MRWLHEWPTFWAGLLVVGTFVVLSLAGFWLTRPWVRKRGGDSNELANYYFTAVAVFYALLVGLIAVANWENHSRIEDVVTGESIAVTDLYRDVAIFSPPLRDEIREMLRRYLQAVIEKEWPQQLRGHVPTMVAGPLDLFVQKMVTLEPSTPGQQIAHGECLRQLNSILSLRRQRIQAIDDGLSRLMWLIVLLGAAATIGLSFLFYTEKTVIQVLLTVALSFVIGLSIFLIFALDGPLVGSDAVQPDSYREALETMNP
jgi:hypothetical protein